MARRKPPPAVTPEDVSLFREAIGAVRRLPESTAPPSAPRPAPEARQRAADERAALRTSREDPFAAGIAAAGEELGYRRDEVTPKVLRRLGRGEYAVQDEVDLHHLRLDAAASLLSAFLSDARRRRHLCVRVVHGKGHGSGDGGSVIKAMTDRLLRQRNDVLAFASAPPAQGGTGAVLVLLSPRRLPGGAAGGGVSRSAGPAVD